MLNIFNKTPENIDQEILNALEEKIKEYEPPASGHRFHIKRYLETFRWLPKESGLMLDLGGAQGIFSYILEKFTSYSLALADQESGENVAGFDFEKDTFTFPDNHFDFILFTEVIEHFREDPMHCMAEINRILKPNGKLLITTPNIASWKSINRALKGEQPGLFVPYMKHGGTNRHNREYTAKEIIQLMDDAGFEVIKADAIDVYDHVPDAKPVKGHNNELRGDTTFCLAVKKRNVKNRMPNWLYWP